MNLGTYNAKEMPDLKRVHNELQWYLGEELGRDPTQSPEDMQELENRFADWITQGGGSEWLASKAKR